MLLDLYEWFLLINDGIDLVLSNLASGTYPVPFSFLIIIILFGLISVLAWRSTDIPDLPPAPRPPYVIQISTGPNVPGQRQTISDVRLLSGGFFDGHEILSRYRIIASRNQSTNTDRNNPHQPVSRASSSSSSAAFSAGDPAVRGVEARSNVELQRSQNIRRQPGRWFSFEFLRRPASHLSRPANIHGVPGRILAQLTSSPNVVVYHRVNVYHHHISSSSQPNSNTTNSYRENNQSETGPPSTLPSVPPEDPLLQSAVLNPQLVMTSSNLAETVSGESSILNSNVVDTSATSSSTNLDRQLQQNPNQNYNAYTSSPTASTSVVESDASVAVQIAAADRHQPPLNTLHSSDISIPSASPDHEDKMTNEETRNDPTSQQGESVTTNKLYNDSKVLSSTEESPTGPGDGNDVRFTIKFLNDTQLDVVSQLTEKIGVFKRRHFIRELSENKTVRLIFNGRVLDNENKTLGEFGIFDQCVVHCLIVNRQQPHGDSSSRSSINNVGSGGGSSNSQEGDVLQGNMRRMVGLPEPGMFFIAFIGIFLIFLWFVCLHFGQHLFTQSAVVSLTVLTAIFLIGIVACYLPIPAN